MSEEHAGPDDLAEPEAELDEVAAEELDEDEEDAESELQDEDDADDSEDGPAQPSNRRGRRIRQLNEKLKAERERAAELEATLQHLATQQQPLDRELDEFLQGEAAAHDARNPPSEVELLRRQFGRQYLDHQLRVRDELDQLRYEQIRREQGLPHSYDQRVEVLLSQARNRGENPSRVGLMQQLMGQDQMRDRLNQRHGGGRYGLSRTSRSSASSPSRGRRSQAEDDAEILASLTVGQAFGLTE